MKERLQRWQPCALRGLEGAGILAPMSITTPDPRISTYNPVVATTEFAAMFPVFDNDDIAVFHNGIERTDFAVTATYIEGVANNAKAVFAVGITGKVQVIGARDPHRTNAFQNGGPLPVRDFNLALNTLESEVQEARRDINRAVLVELGETGLQITKGTGGQIPVFDADGNLIPGTPNGGGNMFREVYDPTNKGADAFDSAHHVFAQVETDARVWDQKSRGREVIMAADFWEVGEADFGPAFQRTADNIPNANIAVVLPRAPIPLATKPLFTDKNLSLVGSGYAGSEIDVKHANGGIKFLCTDTSNQSQNSHRFEVNGLRIVADVVSAAGAGPVALEAQWSFTGSSGLERGKFSYLEIVSKGPGRWFNKGIRLVDGCRIDFDGVKIYNEDGHQTCLAEAPIEIVRQAASNLTGFNFINCKFNRYLNGLKFSQKNASLSGTIEGIILTGGEMVNVAYAIFEDNDTLDDRSIDSITLQGIHWNASRAGFKAGRVRGLAVSNCHLFHSNFGEPGTAPLEAAFNFLRLAHAVNIHDNPNILRTSATTASAPMIRLPTDANINWVNLGNNNLYANWDPGLVIQAGTKSVTKAKLQLGNNTLQSTVRNAGTGYFGDTVSSNGVAATGTVVNFPHTFASAPSVNVNYRGAGTTIKAWCDAITTTGFTLRHDGAGSQGFSWTATEN